MQTPVAIGLTVLAVVVQTFGVVVVSEYVAGPVTLSPKGPSGILRTAGASAVILIGPAVAVGVGGAVAVGVGGAVAEMFVVGLSSVVGAVVGRSGFVMAEPLVCATEVGAIEPAEVVVDPEPVGLLRLVGAAVGGRTLLGRAADVVVVRLPEAAVRTMLVGRTTATGREPHPVIEQATTDAVSQRPTRRGFRWVRIMSLPLCAEAGCQLFGW